MLIRILIALLGLAPGLGYGQVADNFADGNFTHSPAWLGDAEKFEIADEALHLNDAAASGSAYLSTPSEAVADASWELQVVISENPSASNFARIYLMSDQADLSGELQGYFVRVGGSEDDISLYRQDGHSTTKIIDGDDRRVDTKPVEITVRVTRDERGNWQLFSRSASASDFTEEGAVRDEIHTTATHFGIYCQYTSTRREAFYFDDIAVTGVPQSATDTAPAVAQWQDVIVNELMPDPNPVVADLPEAEYVELYNASNSAFQLRTWSLNGKPLPEYQLLPKQYVVVTAATDADDFARYGDVVGLASWPTLSNGGSALVLKNPAGHTVDSLTYSGEAVTGGYALERIRPARPCDQRPNYASTTGAHGGTPGTQNSWFDDQPDTRPPVLERTTTTSAPELRLSFDEAVAAEDIEITTTPSISFTSVEADAADPRTVVLRLTENLVSGTQYSVTVSGAYDCSDNEAAALTTSFVYDNTPPTIEQVVLRDTASLQIIFSEPLAIAGSRTDYTVDQGAGIARSVRWADDSASVEVNLATSLDDGLSHRLTVTGVVDRFGNQADTLIYDFSFRNDVDTVRVISAYQVNVVFGEAPTPAAAQRTENYQIDRGLGPPNVAVMLSAYEVQLIYDRPFSANKTHELRISQLTNAQEVPLSTPVHRFTYDQRAPSLDSVVAVDERTVMVYFNEVVVGDALSPSALAINRSIGTPARVEVLSDGRSLRLHLSRPLTQETTYELSVVGLADQSGTVISSTKKRTFFYDQLPPSLQRAQLISPYGLRLVFHEPLDSTRASRPESYALASEVHPERVSVSAVHPGQVTLHFTDPWPTTTTHLQVTQLADLLGNALAEPIFVTVDNQAPALGQVVPLSAIELRLDFTQPLAVAAMEAVDNYRLDGLTPPARVSITDYSAVLTWSEPWVAHQEHALSVSRIVGLAGTSSGDTATTFVYDTRVASVTVDGSSLTVAFTVPVEAATATELSHYAVTAIGSPVAAILTDSRTVRLVFPRPFDPQTVHTLTLDGLLDQDRRIIPTAQHRFGQGQSPTYHQLLITEVMADPSPTVGLPEVEYVELYNTSDQLLNTTGLRLADASTSAVLPLTFIAPGEYVVLCDKSDHASLASYGRTVSVSSLPSLNSTGDSLRLTDALGQEVFSVAYSDDWYNDAEKRNGGWSLEMVDTQRPCGERDNWLASVAPVGGTPGQENSVRQTKPDHVGPQVLRAWTDSDTVVHVVFSERLDAASVGSARIQLSNPLTARVIRWLSSHKEVVLTLTEALRTKQRYSVRVEGVRDCSGNLIDEAANTTTFVLPETAEPGDVLLSELLFHPRSPGEKFVELYNHADKQIDLRGWSLANVQGDSLVNVECITQEPYLLPPGAYVALTEAPGTLRADYPAAPVDHLLQVTQLPSLPTEAGTVALLNPTGALHQLFSYDRRYHHPILDDPRGVSLERIAWDQPADNPASWQSAAQSVGYATPGYRNSQLAAGGPTSATISVDPPVFAPGHAGHADYTRIHYRLDRAGAVANVRIYDARGRHVRHLVQNATLAERGFLVWDGTTDDRQRAGIGYYLIFFEVFDTQGQVNVFKEKVVIGGAW